MTKKFLSILLLLVMVLSIASVSVFAEDKKVFNGMTYEINDGEITITGCNTSISGNIVIPDTIEGYPVTEIGDDAFLGSAKIKSIMIPDSVISIGVDAFRVCNNLANITVDKNNQYYSSDEYGVLFNKDKTELIQYPSGNSMTAYTIPDSVISIGADAFNECTSLESLTIADSVTSIGEAAFVACINLKSIMIPDSVNKIDRFVFLNCQSLENITVDENNQYYSSDEHGVLFNKDKTELIKYPEANSNMSYKIPDSVITISDYYAISYCYNLKSVTIGKSVTTIGPLAFWWCTNLESVIMPASVTTIVEGAFYDCISLTDVYYGGSEADWANISIGVDNTCLTSANIHYNYVIDEPTTEDPAPDEPATDAPVTDDNNSNNNDGSEASSSFFVRIIKFFMSFFEKIRKFFASLM